MAQHVLDRRRVVERRGVAGLGILAHLDVVLVVATVAMAVLGTVMVYYATRAKLVAAGVSPHYYLTRQAEFVVLGLAVMAVVAAVDYHRFEEWSLVIYGVVVLGLLAVLSPVGKSSLGSQRWFQVGGFQLQPSSFAALAVIVATAVYCTRHRDDMDLKRISLLLVLAAVPILLVVKQPDLGTGIILSVILFTVMVVSGARARYILLVVALAALGIFVVVHLGILKQYQIDRLTSFVNQGNAASGSKAAQGTLYNLQQSKIAIAHGGLTGEGLGHGTQTNLGYVPEQQTDFIFTAVGEELGFAGTASVLAVFGLIVWRILRAAQLARDQLGRLLCAGVFALIAFSVFQNAGMTMGITPITGIPLPFMSYGGSSTIVFFAAVGIALNVGMRRYR